MATLVDEENLGFVEEEGKEEMFLKFRNFGFMCNINLMEGFIRVYI